MVVEALSNVAICSLFVLTFITAKPMYVNVVEPTFNKIGSITYNCKQSIKKSQTLFQASKGCLYIKGE